MPDPDVTYYDEEAVVLDAAPDADAYLLRLRVERVAAAARPFQFVMVKVPGEGFILRRPLSVFDADAGDVLMLVRPWREGTARLCRLRENDRIAVSGPFGRVFEPPADALFVAGGVGLAGLHFALAEAARRGARPRLLQGAKSGSGLYGTAALVAAGAEVTVVTEDGSQGLVGLATDHLPDPLPAAVVACGPRPMYRALRERLRESTTLYVLMEERMACGVGACRSCVAPALDPPGTYVAVCRDGPLFDAAALDWERGV